MNDFYYRKLDAYNLSIDYVIAIYDLLHKYPTSEKFVLCDQIKRAVISIPSNIAEGMGRFSVKERMHFIDISYGSLSEVMCQMEISRRLKYITEDEYDNIENLASRISMTILGLKKSLSNKMNNQQ